MSVASFGLRERSRHRPNVVPEIMPETAIGPCELAAIVSVESGVRPTKSGDRMFRLRAPNDAEITVAVHMEKYLTPTWIVPN